MLLPRIRAEWRLRQALVVVEVAAFRARGKISRELLSEILAGQYDSARRLPSAAQLVERFGVSRPTAARALLDLKAKGVLDRGTGSGASLCKDRAAIPTVCRLGMIVPGLGEIEIFDVICGELAGLARVHDLGMHWGGRTRPSPTA